MLRRNSRKLSLFIILLLLLFAPYTNNDAFAESNTISIDTQTLTRFSEDFFTKNMAKYNIPGAVFVIVKDGKIIYKCGYGFANMENKTKVNPDTTDFNIGSISKLFTTVALLQLEEQGKVDFTKDISSYLKEFKVNNPFRKPITIESLLTHTSGFDELTNEGNSFHYSDNMDPAFEAFVSKNIPHVIREPGEVVQYSNYGFDLAGYLVKDITGMKFTDYIKSAILDPLEMHHSGYNVDQTMFSNLATGYFYADGKYKRLQGGKTPVLGSGGLSASGSDMANLLVALLQGGVFNEKSILSRKSVSEMQERHFTSGEFVNGVCYSLLERVFNGYRVLQQGGADLGFKSELNIIPQEGIGYFISTNADPYGQGSSQFVEALFSEFMLRFYPPDTNKINAAKQRYRDYKPTYSDLQIYEGRYSVTRVPKYSVGKVLSLLAYDEYVVKVDKDQLQIKNGNWTGQYSGIGNNQFINNRSGGLIAFSPDRYGKIAYLSFGGTDTYTKLSWYQTKNLHIALFIFLILVFSGNLFYILYNLVKRRLLYKRVEKLLWFIALLFCGINIGFIICLFVYYSNNGITEILANLTSAPFNVMMTLPLLSLLLTGCHFVYLLIGILRRELSLFYRTYFSVMLVCNVGFILLLNYWCLLGYRY